MPDCTAGESETAGEVTGVEAVMVLDCGTGESETAGEVAAGVELGTTGATVLASGTISIRSWRGAVTTGGNAT